MAKSSKKGKTIDHKDKTTADIVREHLSDKDHKISEADMKVKIDLSLPKDKAHRPLPISNSDERPKDVDKDHDMITPWNVINE